MTTPANKLAFWLLDKVREMIRTELQPIAEQAQRTAVLLAQTRTEIGNDRMAGHEDGMAINRRLDSIVDTVSARLCALEGTGHGTASPAKINVVALHNEIHDVATNHRNRISEAENRAQALAKRVDQLESGRTGHAVQRHVENGGAGRIAFLQRSGPPPGVPDPTTDAINSSIRRIERMEADVNEARHLANVAALEAKEHREARSTAEHERNRLQEAIVSRNKRINELSAEVTAAEKRAKDAERVLADRVNDGLRIADELRRKLTENAARIRDLEEQAQRRTNIDTKRIERLAELEGLDQYRAQLVTEAQTFEATAKTRPRSGDFVLVRACEVFEAAVAEYNRKINGEPEPDDCQAGTCDCPSRPGTMDIAHNLGCPDACTCGERNGGEHKIGCPEMPF